MIKNMTWSCERLPMRSFFKKTRNWAGAIFSKNIQNKTS